jgi:putative salt-induced outer membrane protein YdiY
MMHKHIIAIFIAASFAGCCSGATAMQTNSAAILETNPPPQWDGNVALGLSATAGNSDSVLFTSKFQAHKKTPLNDLMVGGDAAYGETESIKNNETFHAFGQYNHSFSERWYDYARVDALHDGIADVTFRFTFSPGVGYWFIKEKQTSLAGEIGPGGLYEKLDGSYDAYPTLRIAENFEHKFNDHARFWEKMEFLPEADKPADFLVNGEVGVETAITKKISLQVYVDDSFANDPAPGHKDNDVKLVSGLAYKF